MATSTETGDVLEICDAHGMSVRHPLEANRLIIGRSTDADVKLATATVSRRHAELVRDPFQRWWLRDLGSHNGTYVNDQSITEAVLHAGDVVRIGEFTLHLAPAAPEGAGGGVGGTGAKTMAPDTGSMIVASTHEDAGAVSALRQMESAHVATEHLAQLSHFGEQLIATSDAEQRLIVLCRLLVGEQFHGQAALALRLDRAADPSEPRILCPVQHGEGAEAVAPHLSRTLLRAVLASGEAMMATNTRTAGGAGSESGAAGAIELSISPDVMPMAAIACPLRQDERTMDVLYATLPPTYARGEWLALVSLAVRQYEQAELAWAGRRQAEALAAIERELEQAHRLQMRLVPQKQRIAHLDTAIAFEPCRWVGGDYADILALPDGRTLLTVADVCGKGMQAALTTASIHTMVHASVRAGASLVEMMRHLNEHLLEMLPDNSFVTMTCLAVEPATGALECVNAGHPPALVVDAAGELWQLQQARNLPLGIAPDEPEPEPNELDAGAWVALYSDGLTELSDAEGAMIGIDGLGRRLAEACAAAKAGQAEQVTAALLEHARTMRGERMAEDDWTLLVARRSA